MYLDLKISVSLNSFRFVKGPFRGEEMRQWLEAGYFKGDLPISQQTSGPFLPLSALFPDLAVAFRGPSQDMSREEAEAKTAAEDEKRKKDAEEKERRAAKAEQEGREAAERERIEKERHVAEARRAASREANTSNSGNESSAQLKMMLGLSPDGNKDVESEVEGLVSAKRQNADKRSSKGNKKTQPPPAEGTPDTSVVEMAATPAWGGAANTKSKKSISQIQQEEARAAALMAMQRDGIPLQSSSGWANVAASGKAGWSSGTLKQAQVAAAPNSSAVPSTRQTQGHGKAQANMTRNASPNTQQLRSNSTASSTPAEEFGTTMSPALEQWCKEEMQQINGSDDLTLVAFCMTLDDANEIRQYLTTYLGSTSQVNNFATEFITKRGLGNKQEEWETPGSTKKGRKKKNSGR
jgi:hypothetical protein